MINIILLIWKNIILLIKDRESETTKWQRK